jgi:2,3-dihydroxybenzoate decarboxylase
LIRRLADFGEERLAAINRAGIARAVLSLSGPGVQREPDRFTAVRVARQANDFLAREIEKQPDRYAGFAHLAMQDPHAAGDELERCVNDLKFCGAMINGHTNGQYLDAPELFPFWERVEALGAPIYLHPADPAAPFAVLSGCDRLKRATWEWGVETGSHALRLIFNVLFGRFPGARLILGHLGETLPFLLWRFDSRAKLYGLKLRKRPSDYMRRLLALGRNAMSPTAPRAASNGM